MRSIRTKIELCIAGLALLGCEGRVAPPIGVDRPGPPQRGGTLRTAFFTDVRSLDAATAFDTASAAIESLIYDRLVTYDAKGKITPQLAESIDVEDGAKRYVFTLRRGVLFHDGTPPDRGGCEAEHSALAALQDAVPVPSYYERIVGYKAYHNGKAKELTGVRVEGDHVVSIQLTEPDATFLHIMALAIVAPVCKSAGETWDRNFSSKPCGTGPFKVTRYDNGQVIRVVRHDGYWEALDDSQEHERRIEELKSERQALIDRISALPGLKALSSDGNFVLIDVSATGLSADELVRRMQDEGVLIRSLGAHHAEKSFVRVTVGSASDNLRCLGALARVVRSVRRNTRPLYATDAE